MMKSNLNEAFQTFLDDIYDLNDLPGLAAGVYCGSTDSTYIGVRGYADYQTRRPLHEDDIFHCASVSKLFTSTAIMKLVEAGVLNLDDSLSVLLPDLHIVDKRSSEIKLLQMLTHTSGLGDCADYHWDTPRCDEEALADYVYSDEVCKQPMVWESGTGFRYSNVAYEILGYIVSIYSDHLAENSKTGRLCYEDFIRRYCLEPAGMVHSTMKTFERKDGTLPMAAPHERGDDKSIRPVRHYPYTRQHAPSSTLTSNISDLLKWGRAHLDHTKASGSSPIFADPSIYDEIWTPYAKVPNNGEGIGLGWFIRKQQVAPDREFVLYGHEGSDDGFRSSFWICPELDLVTVVLSNISGAPVKKINKKLFAVFA